MATGALISMPLFVGFLTLWAYAMLTAPPLKHTWDCPLVTRGGTCTCGAQPDAEPAPSDSAQPR